MPRMGSANRCDPGGVAGDSQPVVNRSADPPALNRRFASPMVPGDEQDEAVARIFGALQREVDRSPCAVETVAVEVDDAVWLKRSGAELPVPRPVERRSGSRRPGLRPGGRLGGSSLRCCGNRWRGLRGWPFLGLTGPYGFARQGTDGRGHPRPQLRLFRAE